MSWKSILRMTVLISLTVTAVVLAGRMPLGESLARRVLGSEDLSATKPASRVSGVASFFQTAW